MFWLMVWTARFIGCMLASYLIICLMFDNDQVEAIH